MRIVLLYHSLVSDWNHGNAHFLRGVTSELLARGHDVIVYEPADGWSRAQLVAEHGEDAAEPAFSTAFPDLAPVSRTYDRKRFDLAKALDGADLVIVHEWNDHDLVAAVGKLRARRRATFKLLFHDTHHRAVTSPEAMAEYDLRSYDGVLAFGQVLSDLYLERGWTKRAWTWHEAADTRVFRPLPRMRTEADLVWIGNWGDDERTKELGEFLVEPVRALGLDADVYGVRYPKTALQRLRKAGIRYHGWLPNHLAPKAFARHRVTVHVPRRPYTRALPGIPTIRMFEALACGIPLVSAPWPDDEGLFRAGTDYLVAEDGEAMTSALKEVLSDPAMARAMAQRGLRRIRARHTCAHRVDELMAITKELGIS